MATEGSLLAPDDGNIPDLVGKGVCPERRALSASPDSVGTIGVKDHGRVDVKQKGPRPSRDPIPNLHRFLVCVGPTSSLRRACPPMGEQALALAAAVFAKCPTCRP